MMESPTIQTTPCVNNSTKEPKLTKRNTSLTGTRLCSLYLTTRYGADTWWKMHQSPTGPWYEFHQLRHQKQPPMLEPKSRMNSPLTPSFGIWADLGTSCKTEFNWWWVRGMSSKLQNRVSMIDRHFCTNSWSAHMRHYQHQYTLVKATSELEHVKADRATIKFCQVNEWQVDKYSIPIRCKILNMC